MTARGRLHPKIREGRAKWAASLCTNCALAIFVTVLIG